jgi:hypothetical protein
MATESAQCLRRAGQDWLLSFADQPARVQRAWDAETLASFTSGKHWRVAEAPLVPSMDALKRIESARLGPVLADVMRRRAWWLLPPEADDEIDGLRHITVHPRGWVLRCPPVLYPVRSRVWVERPDGSSRLTDPTLLGAALGPGRPQPASEVFA